MSRLTSDQALQLAAHFAVAADRMRTQQQESFQQKARFYERACRVAFLRAGVIARNEETQPVFGQLLRRAVFAVA